MSVYLATLLTHLIGKDRQAVCRLRWQMTLHGHSLTTAEMQAVIAPTEEEEDEVQDPDDLPLVSLAASSEDTFRHRFSHSSLSGIAH